MISKNPLKTRSRRVAAAALVLCAAVLFLTLPPVAAPAVKDSEGLQPIIDAVEVEKPEVCLGEENLVTMHAHTEGNTEDGYLHYRGGGGTGRFLVYRGERPEPDASGKTSDTITQPIGTFGRGNVATFTQASYRVKDCKVDHKLLLKYALLPNTIAEFGFSARLIPFGTQARFNAVRYEWDFGDGTVVNTTEPEATHDFTDHLQAHLFESFLVTATAIDASGKRLVGRTGVELPSHYFHNLQTNCMVTLLVRMTPRMPQMDANGVVTQSYRLWHFDPQPIEVTALFKREVTVESLYANPVGSASHKTGGLHEETVPDIRSILGTTVIPPSGIEFTLKLDTKQSPLAAIDYHVEGVTSTGLRVRGQFPLMRPPIPPTRAHHIPISDPVLKAKIARAQELTGHEVITAEDMARLEKQGKFDDLKPAKPQPAPPQFLAPLAAFTRAHGGFRSGSCTATLRIIPSPPKPGRSIYHIL